MDDIFISEYLNLGTELDRLGVFDAIITSDSSLYINILRLKNTKEVCFKNSYTKINDYLKNITICLAEADSKSSRLYKRAEELYNFHGVKGINLGFSTTGVDIGFGKKLSKKVIADAYEIIKAGCKQPEIFHLVRLFEEGIAGDRLSDMIASLILDDIRNYTKTINNKLKINSTRYPDKKFVDGIVINPYKNCELLYVPKDILHELPIAKSWEDIKVVMEQNFAIRKEINDLIGDRWSKLLSSDRKTYLRNIVFKDPIRCRRVIDAYNEEEIKDYNPKENYDYYYACAYKTAIESDSYNFLSHSKKTYKSSFEASLELLQIFKNFVEDNKGWGIINEAPRKKEKIVQRLIAATSNYYCKQNNIDLTFESNAGPGPSDIKASRGNDKTIMEVKLSTNKDYLNGFESQIEEYAIAEGTDKRIFIYVKVSDNPIREHKLISLYQSKLNSGKNPPYLFVIDARKQQSASKKRR